MNAAILAGGHSPTACDHEVCGNKPYGGGLENFPSFLENWNADVLPDRGSLDFPFYDTQGNGPWKFSTWGTAGRYNWPLPARSTVRGPQKAPPIVTNATPADTSSSNVYQ